MAKRVAFARINVRDPEHLTLMGRTFHDDLLDLAAAGELRAVVGNPDSLVGQRDWRAYDLELTPDQEILSGTIGFTTVQRYFEPVEEAQSWIKGETEGPVAASEQTLVPFAIDVRSDRRWIAFATAQKIRPPSFANAFQAAIQAAVAQRGGIADNWEVDLITSQSTIHDWLAENPDVVLFRRTVRYPNPVRDLQGVHAEMAELAARTKKEEFAAAPGQRLNLEHELPRLLDGVDSGNADAYFQARGDGRTKPRFNTRLASDEAFIDDYGDDIRRGRDLITEALRRYSARRAGEQEEGPDGEFDLFEIADDVDYT